MALRALPRRARAVTPCVNFVIAAEFVPVVAVVSPTCIPAVGAESGMAMVVAERSVVALGPVGALAVPAGVSTVSGDVVAIENGVAVVEDTLTADAGVAIPIAVPSIIARASSAALSRHAWYRAVGRDMAAVESFAIRVANPNGTVAVPAPGTAVVISTPGADVVVSAPGTAVVAKAKVLVVAELAVAALCDVVWSRVRTVRIWSVVAQETTEVKGRSANAWRRRIGNLWFGVLVTIPTANPDEVSASIRA